MRTFFTADDIYIGSAQRIREMVEGEKDRLGCLERAAYAVAKRVPDLTVRAVHKLRRGEPFKPPGEMFLNIQIAFEAWLDEYETYCNERQEWIEGRQAHLEALIHATCDPEFYQGQVAKFRQAPSRPGAVVAETNSAIGRLADSDVEGA